MTTYVIAQLGNYDSICAWLQSDGAGAHFGNRATAAVFASRCQAAKATRRFAGHKFRIVKVGGENDPADYARGGVHNWSLR